MGTPLVPFIRPPVTPRDAVAITGPLSNPSKMPCHGYSLPAKACKLGSVLHHIKGSTCADCYALKGRYRFPNVQRAMERRLAAITHPYWPEAMAIMIRATKNTYFRWHDSGDLQSLGHLMAIVKVAQLLPSVQFWLPTREVGFVRKYETAFGSFPPNLTVRVSAAMVDSPPPRGFKTTSTVVTTGWTCPAPSQKNECGSCRACWDQSVNNVSYKEH